MRASRLLLLLCPLLFACSHSSQHDVSYHQDVEPIIEQKCQGCHLPGGIGPFSLMSYADVRNHAQIVSAALHNRSMPPWPPGPASLPLRGDRSLGDDELRIIDDWVRAGAPEGAQRTGAPPPPPPDVRADLRLRMPVPYTPSNATQDDYRCYELDPRLDRDRWVTGYAVRPGVAQMVHHVNLYFVTDAQTFDEMDRESGEDGKPGWPCVGGPGGRADSTTSNLGSWEPGAAAVTFPEHTALKLPAGARVILLMHYTTAQVTKADQSSVDLQFGDQPEHEARVLELKDMDLKIAPGDAHGRADAVQEIGDDFPATKIYGMFPHMHFFGTSVSMQIEREHGEQTKLIDIPKWEYHWQGMYFLVDPVAVRAGDRLRLTCNYDNSKANQPAVDGKQQDPQTLYWGNRALDEMCLSYVYVTGD